MIVYLFPGQGAQFFGMGKDLFEEFPDLAETTDQILGYSIKELCLNQNDGRLNDTKYTQPALYTVNAMSYMHLRRETGKKPDFVIGNSIGEYNALHAAGVIGYEDGLRLVKVRGELMSEANGGAMAAVIGLEAEKINELIQSEGISRQVSISNYNTKLQSVISGTTEAVDQMISVLLKQGAKRAVRLNVSGAFHSCYMNTAQELFAAELDRIHFRSPDCTIISNRYGTPYDPERIKETLLEQISHPVLLEPCIRYALSHGASEFLEAGPGKTMSNMVNAIKKEFHSNHFESQKRSLLGSSDFKTEYDTEFAYVVGGLYHGVSSAAMIRTLNNAGIVGFLGLQGMDLNAGKELLDTALQSVPKERIGTHIVYNGLKPEESASALQMIIEYDIRRIEISGFFKPSQELILYRLRGLSYGKNDIPQSAYKMIVYVNNPKVMEEFLKPASEQLIGRLLTQRKITEEEAVIAAKLPICDDICIDNVSSGAGRLSWISNLKHYARELSEKYGIKKMVRIGIGGGIGNPEMLALAFLAGADFVTTRSMNQCTAEAETSPQVKDLLQSAAENDFTYAPVEELFEFGEKVSVLKRGTLYPIRALKLYEIYTKYNSIEEISEKEKKLITEKYFHMSFEEMFERAARELTPAEQRIASEQPKYKMSLIFKGFLKQCLLWAQTGKAGEEINFAVVSGSEMADANRWLKNSGLEEWSTRHVDELAKRMMEEGEAYLKNVCMKYIGTFHNMKQI